MSSKQNRIFTTVLLSVYVLILAWIVLLKLSAIGEWKYLFCERSLNLIPFYYENEVGSHLEEVVLNVFIFVPFGMYLTMLGSDAWKAILIGFGLSLLFEAVQYVCTIGAADVTDLLMNTLGTAIGVGGYLLLRKLCRRSERLNTVLNVITCVAIVLFLLAAAVLLIANR